MTLNVICVDAHDYQGCGETYVRKLREGVERHLTLPHRFVTLTEAHIPDGVRGWWSKLCMFRPETLEQLGIGPGERMFYLDLDTVIVGNIDDIAGYDGPFAGLADMFQANRFNSGVMSWTSGEADGIWRSWDRCGRPDWAVTGDQAWIDQVMPDAVFLQRLFPGQIVSFKVQYLMGRREPDPRIVCFHGQPRPHHLKNLMENW